MVREWEWAPLGELVAEVFDRRGVTPEKLGSSFQSSGHRVISAKHIKSSRIDLEAGEDRFVDDITHERWMRSELTPGDVLVTSEAPLGEVALIYQRLPWCLGQRLFGLRPGPTVDGRFLYFALRSPVVQVDIQSRATGTTAQGIRQPELLRVQIPVPHLSEQRAIGAILGALEEKVEANRRLNDTLDTMARALFKSWFVDFDPVRARIAGRSPFGMDATTAGLFPTKQSPDGIPTGWVRRPLGEWVDALSGGTPSKGDSSLWGGDVPWISPKVMTEIFADEAESFVTPAAIGNGTRLAPAGATLVMVRGMGLHECVRVSQARREVTFNQDVKALVPRHIAPSLLLLALLDAQADLLLKVESSGHGTGKLPSEILLAHPIIMPALDAQHRLSTTFDTLLDRIALTRQESRTLAELRDLLLPKLLSGELRIREAEKAVEAVL